MNKIRRKRIEAVIASLNDLTEMVGEICEEEEDYFDNIPENLQESERACAAEEAVDNLNSAIDSLEEAIGYLREAIEM